MSTKKPRGRINPYALFVQSCREEHKIKHPGENVVFVVFSRKCAERWKVMTEAEKQPFKDAAAQDKQRFDYEMKDYVPPKGTKNGKRRRQPKDPNAPKRSLSAFFWFAHDERPKAKGLNPNYRVGDIAKVLARLWAECPGEVKSKYEAMASRDKARYQREMMAYRSQMKGGQPQQQHYQHQQQQDDDDDEEDYEDDDE